MVPKKASSQLQREHLGTLVPSLSCLRAHGFCAERQQNLQLCFNLAILTGNPMYSKCDNLKEHMSYLFSFKIKYISQRS